MPRLMPAANMPRKCDIEPARTFTWPSDCATWIMWTIEESSEVLD